MAPSVALKHSAVHQNSIETTTARRSILVHMPNAMIGSAVKIGRHFEIHSSGPRMLSAIRDQNGSIPAVPIQIRPVVARASVRRRAGTKRHARSTTVLIAHAQTADPIAAHGSGQTIISRAGQSAPHPRIDSHLDAKTDRGRKMIEDIADQPPVTTVRTGPELATSDFRIAHRDRMSRFPGGMISVIEIPGVPPIVDSIMTGHASSTETPDQMHQGGSTETGRHVTMLEARRDRSSSTRHDAPTVRPATQSPGNTTNDHEVRFALQRTGVTRIDLVTAITG